MENLKNELATKLKDANNVLVTVSTNPTVDQLSAAIGLTLFLTKLKKHATTVYSGQTPSTIDFLKPEETIETNTNSLRDFIISLDKNKADKIRYKVEDTMVKIFITPYKTSISDEDLVFSQGDFNIDVVIALGIQKREDIDQAIMTHGRILHDAIVATVNLTQTSELGSLNWTDPNASSLCEMMVAVTDKLQPNSLDGQMATAFLTGIVAETERFSNEKTTSITMSASAKLMAAGANQQLVATQLEPLPEDNPDDSDSPDEPDDGDGNNNYDGTDDNNSRESVIEEDGSLRISHPVPPIQTDEPTQTEPQFNHLPKPWSPTDVQDTSTVKDTTGISDTTTGNDSLVLSHRSILKDNGSVVVNSDTSGLLTSEKDSNSLLDGNDTNKRISEPPQFGGHLSATANKIGDDINALNIVSPKQHVLSRTPQQDIDEKGISSGEISQQDESEFKPESEETKNSVEPLISFPVATETMSLDGSQNLPDVFKAPPVASPITDPIITDPIIPDDKPILQTPDSNKESVKTSEIENKTIDDLETQYHEKEKADKQGKVIKADKSVDYKKEAINHITKVMSGKTLGQIEEKLGRIHNKSADSEKSDFKKQASEHVAKVMSNQTIDQIEERVAPEHSGGKTNVNTAIDIKKPSDDNLGLSYEPHESEPEDKSDLSKITDDNKDNKMAEPTLSGQPLISSNKTVEKSSKEAMSSDVKTSSEEAKPAEQANEPGASNDKDSEQNDAREAVLRAINAGGDGRTSLPPLQSVGSSGTVAVEHISSSDIQSKPPAVPPPITKSETPIGTSPIISIDPEDGTLIPLARDYENEDEVSSFKTIQNRNGDKESSPPSVPPPMLPPSPIAVNGSSS